MPILGRSVQRRIYFIVGSAHVFEREWLRFVLYANSKTEYFGCELFSLFLFAQKALCFEDILT